MLTGLFAAAALSCAAAAPLAGAVDADELLRLRDISGLSVSPNGRHIAFQLQQARPKTDDYASAWCVAPLDGRAAPETLGDGGDIIMPATAFGRRSGVWTTLAARWSPDSRRIAVLARRGAETQIEVCTLGARCRRVTQSEGDAEDLVWSEDGRALIFQTGAPRQLQRQALAREGARGFHFDDRFDIYHALAPVRWDGPRSPQLRRIDLRSGRESEASSTDRDLFMQRRPSPASLAIGTSRSLTLFSQSPAARVPTPDGRDVRQAVRLGADGAVWTEPADPARAGMVPPLRLHARMRIDGAHLPCSAPECAGRIIEFAPTRDGRAVLFIRREGWADSRHGVYLWDLAANAVRTLLITDDAIRACTALADRAICFHEAPTQPRRIVVLTYAEGALTQVFDPNPRLPAAAFAPAQKLEWRAPDGRELFGYLVLPPNPPAGARSPLIVVQYRATGFLRGGVGDEYPVQAFARRGFAVLVLERPDPMEIMAVESDPDEFDRMEWRNLAERRRTLDALVSGIAHVVSLGVADPERVGVTGLSDGAETALFALIHCSCAAAYAVSGGFHDPISLYLTSDRWRADMRASGRGEIVLGEGALWAELSPALNGEHIRAPVLAQMADREVMFALQTERTFADLGLPFDLYVFPDEYHVKWRPRHRQAIYARNLDWFMFWLMGVERDDPARAGEYARWRAWRDALQPRP